MATMLRAPQPTCTPETKGHFMEEMTPSALLGAYLEVEEARFGIEEIHYLYANAAYPLKRAVTPTS